MVVYLDIFSVRFLRVCSFYYDGHTRASERGTGCKYGSHAIFFHLTANEVSPAVSLFMKVLKIFYVGLLALLTWSCSNEPENPNGGDFDFSLDRTRLTLEVNTTATLTAVFDPSDVKNTAHEWRSSNPDVATVSESGVVNAVSQGQATITATALANNKTASCEITVVDKIIAPTSITLSSSEEFLLVGEKLKLNAVILPETANDRSIRWTSENTEVATVDETGVVEAHSIGVTEITATTSNNKSAKCTLTVGDKGVEFSNVKVDVLDDSSVKVNCTLSPRGLTITEAGICIDKTTTPTLSSSTFKVASTSTVAATISKLEPNTRYFLRIYAKSGEDVFYSTTTEFTTQGSIVTNFKIKEIWLDKLIFEAPIIPGVDLNVCYGIAPHPEITDNLAKVKKDNDHYVITLDNLSEAHKYYLCAYTLKDGKPKYYDNEGSAATMGYEGQTIKVEFIKKYSSDGCCVKATTNFPNGTYKVINQNNTLRGVSRTIPKEYNDGDEYIYINGGEQNFYIMEPYRYYRGEYIFGNLTFEDIGTGVIFHWKEECHFNQW